MTTVPDPIASLAAVRRPVPPRPSAAAVAAVLLALVLSGCGSSGNGPAPASTTAAGAGATSGVPASRVLSPGTTRAKGTCVSRMPGEVLAAIDAVVQFSTSQVCPGYVTVRPGTPVTFTNEDAVAHTVTIQEGTLPGGKTIASGSAPPGGSWVQPFDTLGSFTYVLDAIPSFRGTVEVTDGTMTGH